MDSSVISSSSQKKMKLSPQVLDSFGMAKLFKDNQARINSIDFFRDGELLITSSDDESLNLYNVNSGKKQKTIFSKKYGVDLVRFTHHNNAVICASKNGWDESLRYLSLHDNKYLRYFKGHRDQVVSLAMCPKDDTFISSSLDNTIRLWDLNTNMCQGMLRRAGRNVVTFDPQGVVFAAACSVNTIKLYDIRSFDKGPFSSFVVNSSPVEWTGIKISNDGKYILAATNTNVIFLLDAFKGELKQTYTSFVNNNKSVLEASFSPDGQFVLCGDEDGKVHIWETLSGREVTFLNFKMSGPVSAVQWSPKAMLIATADSNLAFWIPEDIPDQ